MYKSLRQQTLHYFARPQQAVLRTTLSGPAAWTGRQMRECEDWKEVLSAANIAEIDAALNAVEATLKPLAHLSRSDISWPAMGSKIEGWRQQLRNGRGFVLIRGLPVERWGQARSELFFWSLGLHLGIPGAQNPQGDLLGHVRDQRTSADVRYYRTNKNLAVHCDTADLVGLLCLARAKSGGLSRIVSSVTVYNELLREEPKLIELLYQPFWFDTKGEGGIPAFPVPPCRYANGELRSFWQSDYYRSVEQLDHVPALTPQRRLLLDRYDEIASRPDNYLDMDLAPGDVQLLSNHTVLHARTAFEDYAEPERRRHLLRLWLSLPERRPLGLRLKTTLSWFGLVGTAGRELLRARARRSSVA